MNKSGERHCWRKVTHLFWHIALGIAEKGEENITWIVTMDSTSLFFLDQNVYAPVFHSYAEFALAELLQLINPSLGANAAIPIHWKQFQKESESS